MTSLELFKKVKSEIERDEREREEDVLHLKLAISVVS